MTKTTNADGVLIDWADCPKCGASRFWPSGRCMQGCDNFVTQKPKAQADTTSYQRLDPDARSIADAMIDATIEGLQDYAGMMERGEIPMCSGPRALRDFAESISLVRIQQERAERGD